MGELYGVAIGKALRVGAIVLSFGMVGWLGFYAGTSSTTRVYEARLSKQQSEHDSEARDAAESAASTLRSALEKQRFFADEARRLGLQLLNTDAALTKTKELLNAQINQAVRVDGPRYTGLGPDSLRVYSTALGYTATGGDTGAAADPGNAAEARQAPGAEQGLPPQDLLAHARDYGQWCQQLEGRLDAYIELHQGVPLQ
ncbi:hypothetical protein [Jeongeupia chitinilytica]|uniref:Uncharacterized protein n=1 Tax=Jeongeupia chitinilytica TaxID=1041641 RepID=A0ABQ3H200_9NEIS|nr:hypothetical protein [Jeongeupia chitinilytica]GHD63807.1 hypothetical protein GCM10007350_22010 [Jeongeupia chitinilytica]